MALRLFALWVLLMNSASGLAQTASNEVSAAPAEALELVASDVTNATPEPFFNDSVSAPVTVVCPFKAAVGYEAGEVSCGFIEVPENRSDPDSRTIRLLFAKLHAKAGLEPDEEAAGASTDEEDALVQRDDPIAYLTGGPGVAIPPYVERFLEHDLLKTRDIYILQQRGIEESGAFCPFFGTLRPELSTARSMRERELETAQRMQDCLRAARARGIDITAYNTLENARDVRAFRRAMGFGQWNVWGISYGSHLGQMLAQVDPEGVRALVLDAIVPNNLQELMRLGKWMSLDFQQLFERCEATQGPHCEGLEARFEALLDAPHLRVEAADKEVFPSGEFYLPPFIGPYVAFMMMYEQDKYPALPAVLDHLFSKIERGDADLFTGVGSMLAAGGDQGMSTAIRCNDGYFQAAADDWPKDQEAYPRLTSAISSLEGSRALAQACIDSGVPPRDRADYQLVQSAIPTLIVNGTWDPITPAPLAELIAPGFSNGRLILVPYAGHGPTRSMSECAGEVMGAFYDDPQQDLETLDATCFEEGPGAPEFIRYQTSDLPLMAATLLAQDEKKPLALAGFSAGMSALVLVISLLVIPFGVVSRWEAKGTARALAIGDSGTRWLAFLVATTAVAGLSLLAAGAAKAYKVAEESLIAGLAAPAPLGSWFLLLAAVLGLVLFWRTIALRRRGPLRIATLLGFLLIAVAAIALFVTAWRWDLGPFG